MGDSGVSGGLPGVGAPPPSAAVRVQKTAAGRKARSAADLDSENGVVAWDEEQSRPLPIAFLVGGRESASGAAITRDGVMKGFNGCRSKPRSRHSSKFRFALGTTLVLACLR